MVTAAPLRQGPDTGPCLLPRASHAAVRTRVDAARLTSNRPVDDWGKLLGDTAAVTALRDRLVHHAHVLKCGPRSWRTKLQTDLRTNEGTKFRQVPVDETRGHRAMPPECAVFCGLDG